MRSGLPIDFSFEMRESRESLYYVRSILKSGRYAFFLFLMLVFPNTSQEKRKDAHLNDFRFQNDKGQSDIPPSVEKKDN